MTQLRSQCLLILLLLLPFSAKGQEIETVEYILERFIEAMGGPAAVERVNSVRLRGNLLYPNGSRNAITVLKKKPNKVRVVVNTGSVRFVQGFDGQTPWFSRYAGRQVFHDRMRGDYAQRFIREAPLLSVLVAQGDTGIEVTRGPDIMVVNKACYTLIGTFPDGRRSEFDIDKAELRQLRIREYDEQGNLEVEIVPSNFERHGGIDFAMRIVHRSPDGEVKSTLIIDEVIVNFGVLESAFSPPDGVRP
jgi:hypothetical protein